MQRLSLPSTISNTLNCFSPIPLIKSYIRPWMVSYIHKELHFKVTNTPLLTHNQSIKRKTTKLFNKSIFQQNFLNRFVSITYRIKVLFMFSSIIFSIKEFEILKINIKKMFSNSTNAFLNLHQFLKYSCEIQYTYNFYTVSFQQFLYCILQYFFYCMSLLFVEFQDIQLNEHSQWFSRHLSFYYKMIHQHWGYILK